VDRVLFRSDVVTVGAFRASPADPRFHDSGPIEHPIFVFPRTSVVICHEDGAPFATDTCTVTYYNEGQRYTRDPLDPRGDVCEWFSVRPDVLVDVLSAQDPAAADRPDRPFLNSHGRSDAEAYALQRRVVRYVEDPAARDGLGVEEAVLGVLERLVALLPGRARDPSAGPSGPETRKAHRDLAQHVRSFLRDRYTGSDTLDAIAGEVGCSAFHMCRVFRAQVGTTIHRYRTQLRLRRSLEMVAGRSRDLSRIAFELGFSSHSHFTAAFHDAFGTPPSEFRRRATAARVRDATLRLRERASAD
jgi:AraC-like DNA-binding protein